MFMVRGMVTPFKMPIFYDFDVDADLNLVTDMITEVEAVGGRVRAVVCDMGNSKFLGKDGVKLYQKGNHSFPNPARPDDTAGRTAGRSYLKGTGVEDKEEQQQREKE